MATSIGNYAAKVTANAKGFAAGMASATGPLDRLQRKVTGINRIMKVGFSFFALKGFIGMIRKAWQVADQLGVKISALDRKRLDGVQGAFNGWRAATAKLVLELGARLAPVLVGLLNKATQFVAWLNAKLTPAMLSTIGKFVIWTAGIYAGIKAIGLLLVVLDLWKKREQALALAMAIRTALSGPAGWAVLAAGVAVAAGAVYGITTAFKSFSDESQRGLHGTGLEVDRLSAKMKSMEKGAMGIRGIDFKGMAAKVSQTRFALPTGHPVGSGVMRQLLGESQTQTKIMRDGGRYLPERWESYTGTL